MDQNQAGLDARTAYIRRALLAWNCNIAFTIVRAFCIVGVTNGERKHESHLAFCSHSR